VVENRLRQVGVVVGRYGVVYPGIATVGAFGAATVLAAEFETVLFAVFAVAVIVTGLGAMHGSASNDALQTGGGVPSTANPGERWEDVALVKLGLFDLGLAVVLSIDAAWWAVSG
jgi:hypothetical protein